MLKRAVDHTDGAGAVIEQPTGGEFAHLPGAQQEHFLVFECAEDLASEFYGSVRNRNRRVANPGLSAHAPRDRECLLQYGIEKAAGCTHLLRLLPSLFHLGNDLRLAEHPGVKAGCDPENMEEGSFIQQAVKVLPLAQLETIFGGQQTHY